MCLLLVLSCYLSYSSTHCCLLYIFDFIEHCSMLQGAVENVLERSSFMQLLDGSVVELDQHSRNLILESLREMSTSALRCLGFAYKDELLEFETYNGHDHPAHQLLLEPSNYSSIESKLIFVGLVGLRVSCLMVSYMM
jgi:Ca2+-transporting ATPase